MSDRATAVYEALRTKWLRPEVRDSRDYEIKAAIEAALTAVPDLERLERSLKSEEVVKLLFRHLDGRASFLLLAIEEHLLWEQPTLLQTWVRWVRAGLEVVARAHAPDAPGSGAAEWAKLAVEAGKEVHLPRL